ncbi:hypothetical protein [Cryptosporidium parvum Iowa II]|uniref:Uncharacterized protein n=2 Tax=Cryptosporidium parvum TaxID=5807 RepID=Q5CR44_CRYPI|nr:hypothetical protein [Cryptosporidium parvum Iowa II]EAK87872.1 hypothetical protein cgd4_2170 [Cryptosporidium parvum Iowa II]QOY42224.1 Uncharacterized protein CPATCC_0020520 [Cryptosporidium parvum]WKS77525.1 hypothetical protein CPCDC_4g2170 [Cryptosporidium sp. 43IA8]WRK31801.1 Uncharacterized protein cpbgf_4002170 [Cryptosporidium parvum]|eukprot:QOY42224.1 hypothetical protein CPATCC_001845 [Cryptosporidium parvum]
MMQFPELLKSYLLKKKKLEDLSPIYVEILNWLDSDSENYSLTIKKLTQLCNYMLSNFNSNGQINSHLNYLCSDILSIIYDRSSKYICFPSSCYCNICNPFENMKGYEQEYEFWKLLRDLSMNIALKCSPKEGYIIFIEVILGSISLPIFSDKEELSSQKTREESQNMYEKINPVLFSKEKKILPRFYRYLGLYYSLICISRMKRNKAQFITSVCSLVLRKLVYDIECNSLYACNCNPKMNGTHRYCTTLKMLFLKYLVDNIIKLLFDCLTESKSDAEYKDQEIGIFNSELSEGNINVTQHTIYSFLMKVLENILVIDLHNVEILNNSGIYSKNKNFNQNTGLFSSVLTNKPTESILNVISSEMLDSELQKNFSNNKNEWVEIIYKLCYNISYLSPYSMIDTLNNIPICVYDVETQSGDLDVTPLTLSCYAYALFVILEIKYPIAVNYLYPKKIISLTTKLNIIYRATTIFLIFSDGKKLGHEINRRSLGNQEILLSYFNAFQPKNISKSVELVYKYHALIFNRLQEKAYFLIDNNINNFLKCKKTAPNLFSTIYGLNWHQNILVKQAMLSFTRNISDIMQLNNLNKLSSKLRISISLYKNLFDKFTRSLNECYRYSVLFNLYFDLMEFQKDLLFKNLIHSANVIIGVLDVIRGILWKDICNNGCDISTYIKDINKIIIFSSTFFTNFKKVNLDSSQSDKMMLIVLNLIKLILLSYKNNGTRLVKDIVKYLVKEPNTIKKYIFHIKSVISEMESSNFNQFGTVHFIIEDIEEILDSF